MGRTLSGAPYARSGIEGRPKLQDQVPIGKLSGVSSKPADEPNDPDVPAIRSEPAPERAPLDFSGASLGFQENLTRAAPCIDDPLRSPERALEPSELSDSLCAKISTVSFGDRVFLHASEADAWRFAINMIRRYHCIVGRPRRRRVIVCVGVQEGTGGRPPGLEGDDGIVLLRTDEYGALLAEVDERTAGILIAPVRMRAGFELIPGELLVRLREMADEYGLILAFDETFCGFGRSGMLWAHEWTGVTPDLMVAADGQGQAQWAALVVTQRVARGAIGHPLFVDPFALLAGHALMDALLAPGVQERVQNRSWRLEDQLSALLYRRRGIFTALSGLGLMQGLTCSKEAEPLCAMLAERGLITHAMGSVLGLFPPLTVEESEIDAAVSIIDQVSALEEP